MPNVRCSVRAASLFGPMQIQPIHQAPLFGLVVGRQLPPHMDALAGLLRIVDLRSVAGERALAVEHLTDETADVVGCPNLQQAPSAVCNDADPGSFRDIGELEAFRKAR
jgi:hypothetical protein